MKKLLYIIIGILLLSCSGQGEEAERMKHQLQELQAQNKAYIPFTSDSIAKELAQYFDTHGTTNEQMTAHYLLGCVYRDLGEVPHATDCMLTAIEHADTTKSDCDFNMISTIYGQLGELYHNQLLLTNEINARHLSAQYAKKANSPFYVAYEHVNIANAYILLNKTDSAELLLKQSKKWFLTHGYTQDAILASKSLIHIYTNEHKNYSETKKLIDEFEASSKWFDQNHNLPPQKRMFYYYKGSYYLHCQQLDSAEYYFRKMNHKEMSYTTKDAMYKGLLEVYRNKHNADSVLKYSLLYCNANDSSIAKRDYESTAQIAALFNYNHYKHQAIGNEAKAKEYKWILNISVPVSMLIIFFIIIKYRETKETKLHLKAEYSNLSSEYNKNQETLQLLQESHQSAIAAIEQENEGLKARIEGLKKHDVIKEQASISKTIAETDIVKQITYILNHPKAKMSDEDWLSLSDMIGEYYPSLLHDLNRIPKITQQEMRTCILLCLSLRESDIAVLLETSTQRITNVKSSLNSKLFKDNSARTLFKNLTSQYDIYTL